MANKTIYGCVNSTNGEITFEGEACDSGDYTGCIETSGEHAGQVKVVISEVNCDDIYYGCVNWTTGKFQLVIPDDCCGWYEDCNCDYCDNCPECYAPDLTLKYLAVRFTGVRDCSDDSLFSWNGTVFCPYSLSEGLWGYNCSWWVSVPAMGSNVGIVVYATGVSEEGVSIQTTEGTDYYFQSAHLNGGCPGGTYSNELTKDGCGGGGGEYLGYGGQAEVHTPCI